MITYTQPLEKSSCLTFFKEQTFNLNKDIIIIDQDGD
jgi:hypothetical protein